MRFSLRALLALMMMAAGLSIAAAPTYAACGYGGCVDTTTKISGPRAVKAGKRFKICAKVTVSGNVNPRGTLRIAVKGADDYSERFNVGGKKEKKCIEPKLKTAGKYKITATFVGDDGFHNSEDTRSVTVKKSKKPKKS